MTPIKLIVLCLSEVQISNTNQRANTSNFDFIELFVVVAKTQEVLAQARQNLEMVHHSDGKT